MLAFIWVPVTLLNQTQLHLCTQDPSAWGHREHGPGQLLVGALQPGQQLCCWPMHVGKVRLPFLSWGVPGSLARPCRSPHRWQFCTREWWVSGTWEVRAVCHPLDKQQGRATQLP